MVAGALSPPRAFDVAILGSTGFTGKLATEYLSKQSGIKWLAAGRSEQKLAKLNVDPSCVRIVDCTDAAAVEALVKEVRVVANFAGTPFADKALPVVEACVKHGTHYIDVTGENHLHRASYDNFHEQAMASKSLVIHSCGYDSVPSDLAGFLAVNKLNDAFGVGCQELKTFGGEGKGGFSGGTLATILGALTGRTKDYPGMKEASAKGVYALDPVGATGGPDTSDYGGVGYDDRVGTWHMPTILAGANGPVVRKSAALLKYSKSGKGMRYSEVAACKSRWAGWIGTVGLAVGGACLAIPPIRGLLFKMKMLPLPGEGPPPEVRESGYFHTWVLGVGETDAEDIEGPMVIADVRSGTAGDPGYKATAQMAIESALCLALQREECAPEGGVLTPASALGNVLVDRLNKSGMQLSASVLGEPTLKTPGRKRGAQERVFVG